MFDCSQKGCKNWTLFKYCNEHSCEKCRDSKYECKKHRCQIDDCLNTQYEFYKKDFDIYRQYNSNYCKKHYYRTRCRYKCCENEQKTNSRYCTDHECHVNDCSKPSYINGICHEHYSQFVSKIVLN